MLNSINALQLIGGFHMVVSATIYRNLQYALFHNAIHQVDVSETGALLL
jgi:hypothetical protein